MRRAVLRGLAILTVLGALALGWGLLVEPGLTRTTVYRMDSPKWPAGTAPLRMVALADLHVGAPHAGLDRLRAVVDATNALEPDLIVLLGDYVINGVVGGTIIPIGPIAEELRRLQAPLGTVAILGNHDWWTDGPAIVAALEGAGITVLENRALRLERPGGAVWLAGIADDTTRAPDVPGTLAQVTDAGPVIVLAHDPASFADVPARPVVTLSGHTHGGQIFLPLLGAPMVPGRAPRRWAYGHIVEAGRDLIVSAGIGTSILPIRINMPPEIVVVEFGPAGR